jgi:hypothetical protein
MQLELAFFDLPAVPDEGSTGPWDRIDPQAQTAALVLLLLFGDNQDGCRIASSWNAPERVEHCLTRLLPAPRRFVNPLHRFCSAALRGVTQTGFSVRSGDPAFPSRPGAAQATARSGGDWEERSHPQPRTARCCARAWRGWRAPDLPRSEHRGTLSPVEDRASAHPLRSVTSRNRCCISGVERCLPRHLSRSCRPKHHFMRQRVPPRFHPAL